jgi:hypothetical protein
MCNHRQVIRNANIEELPWCGDCCVQMETPITAAIKQVEAEIKMEKSLAALVANATPQTQLQEAGQ